MNPIATFDGCEANYINAERLNRTVRLVPSEPRAAASYGDILKGLCDLGIEPDEVQGLYKVSPFEHSFSVMFAYSDTVEKVIKQSRISIGRNNFDIMKMSEQLVTLRIHWLPLYFDNAILSEIFSQYGEVLEIKLLKSAYANVVAFDGVREIRMKVDEFQKQQIPHLVKFNSGQSILVTMTGRPPYCLRCQGLGHTRQRCPGKSYAAATTRETSDMGVSSSPPPASDVADPSQTQAPEVSAAPQSEPSGTAGEDRPIAGQADVSVGRVSGTEQGVMDQNVMDQNGDQALKRGRDIDDGEGSFITPNRVARVRPPRHHSLTLRNAFSPVTEVDDIGDLLNA